MKQKKDYAIRRADKKYASACIKLSKKSWPTWWSKNETLGKRHIRNCIQEKRCLVATLKGEVIAFLVWGDLWNKIHLQDIFVKEDYRRKGLGTKLIEHAINLARKKGYKEIISDADVTNKKSMKFHLKIGFKKCGFIKNNWDNEDSYIFSRKI